MCGLLCIGIALHSFANFSFGFRVSSNPFLNLKVIVGVTKDNKWYSAIDS